jgi:hypothetical protein
MSNNPTHSAPWIAALALAQSCPRCGARTRSGRACQSAAMPNGRCRMHGGSSPGAPRGESNGMWRHGLRSIETIQRRREMTAEMRELRRLIRALREDQQRVL